ncbi:MAG TPA: tetratricopeptide repeat protein [Gemmataceae bacterium]|nr:tetratricopeptide repeat protein [Gemmataceae bacterium]
MEHGHLNNRRVLLSLLFCLLTAVFCVPAAPARYAMPALKEVPVARLLENLANQAAKNPKDAEIRLNLARVHALAYAHKVESIEANPDKQFYGPWNFPTAGVMPFTVKQSDDAVKTNVAQAHLEKAIEHYKDALKLNDKSQIGKLGLGWCLDQAKQKDAAIKMYRDVIEEAWKTDSKLNNLPNGKAITLEAAGYLLPLLDKQKDKQEIATLEQRVGKLKQLKPLLSPVVIPLREGLTAYDMVDSKAKVRFDVDGMNSKSEWTWFTKDAGILVYDPKGKRQITSGIQLFGNVTFWMFWQNGYEALRALDDNGDGVLSGKELDGIAVWIDANGDGACQPGEIKTLAELGIVTISCRYDIDHMHPDRVPFSNAGVTFRDGSTRTTFDVYLKKW